LTKLAQVVANTIATWFGAGYVPKAPGTAGSLAAIAVAWVVHHFTGLQWGSFAYMAMLLLPVAVWSANVVARTSGVEDPQIVVVDEVVGQWLTLAGAAALNWKSWLAAFVLFRLFDMWKPFPIRRMERLPGGLGIVADDALAGVYGALVMFAAGWFNLY
jgi:phosphatidylglycerophosphatase A